MCVDTVKTVASWSSAYDMVLRQPATGSDGFMGVATARRPWSA
jgi:hypothetical protein